MFRLIDVGFWDDPQFAGLSAPEMGMTAMLFTNIHTQPCGIYRISISRISALSRLSGPAAVIALKRLEEIDVAYFDGVEVCIPGYIKRQRYKGPQMARRCAAGLAQAKNAEYVAMIEERYPEFLKLGGYKCGERKGATKQLFPGVALPPDDAPQPEAAAPRRSRGAGLEELALLMADKLKFTGGVKRTVLERLVKAEPLGEEGVRAAVERAARYFATAKAERWKSFVIARRFSKFCEFYGEAFSSDEALEAYVERIRAANAREERVMKRAASLQAGAQRPEPESPDVASRKQREAVERFLAQLPPELVPLRKLIVRYYAGKMSEDELFVELNEHFRDDKELNAKTDWFLRQLKKPQRTADTEAKYRGRYILGRFGFPPVEG